MGLMFRVSGEETRYLAGGALVACIRQRAMIDG